jgi:peptidoglycan/xylan/chitin deacetylase (PgdA/CDA1 family)
LLREAQEEAIHIEEEDIQLSCSETTYRRALWWELVQSLSGRDAQYRLRVLNALHKKLPIGSQQIDKLRESSPNFRRFFLLTVKQLRDLSAQGMTIGAHTVHHPVLSRAPDDRAREEIMGSRERLEAALNRDVWAFAYPFGDPGSITSRDLALVEDAKFACAFVNVGGGFGAEPPRFALPRIHVTSDMSLAEFEVHVSGFYRRLRGFPSPVAQMRGAT